MSKILVTGGAGFIGSHLVERLVAANHEVVVCDDFSSGSRDYLAACPGVRVLTADVVDLPALASELQGVEIIFHLAALISSQDSLYQPDDYLRVNVTGTLRAIQTATLIGARRIVLASSSTVYGNLVEPLRREEMLPAPITVYSLSKLASEHLLALYAPLHGYSYCALRMFNVYGPRQRANHPYANVACKLAHAVVSGGSIDVYGDGDQTRDFVYVDDVVSAFVSVAEGSKRSLYNVGSGTSRSINALIQAVERAGGARVTRRDLPPWPNDIRQLRADVSRLEDDHAWKPSVDMDEGLTRTIAYFRSALR